MNWEWTQARVILPEGTDELLVELTEGGKLWRWRCCHLMTYEAEGLAPSPEEAKERAEAALKHLHALGRIALGEVEQPLTENEVLERQDKGGWAS